MAITLSFFLCGSEVLASLHGARRHDGMGPPFVWVMTPVVGVPVEQTADFLRTGHFLRSAGTSSPDGATVSSDSSVCCVSRAGGRGRRSISHAPRRDKSCVHCTVNDINLTHMRGRCVAR